MICGCGEIFESIFPFWPTLTEKEKDYLCSNSQIRSFKKGENIHGGGEECGGGILVQSGCVRAYILSDDGREVTLYRLWEGDICMLSASCVLKSITFDVMVDAEEDSRCCMISGTAFSKLAAENINVENYALNVAVSRFSDVMWVFQQILFMSLDKRLAIFLVDEASKNGSDTINLNREQIAKYIGSAREAVSRMLKYFAAEGIVENSRSGIKIIDKKRLRELTL